jgi:hypothetical protein
MRRYIVPKVERRLHFLLDSLPLGPPCHLAQLVKRCRQFKQVSYGCTV